MNDLTRELGKEISKPETGIKIPFYEGLDFQYTLVGNLGQVSSATRIGPGQVEVLNWNTPTEAANYFLNSFMGWWDSALKASEAAKPLVVLEG